MQENTFKTKTGFCHVLPDKIVISRDGIVGNVAKRVVGNTISRILMVYGSLAMFLAYAAIKDYQEGELFLSIILGVVSIFLTYGIFISLNNSATPIIERNKIKSIQFKKGISILTRSRFEVIFEDENQKIKKRLVMLPGSMSDGNTETQKTLQIMRKEGLVDK